MKKYAVILCSLFMAANAFAGWQDDFGTAVQAANGGEIKDFARDIGALVGMNDFHTGKEHRIDAGLTYNVIKNPSDGMMKKYADSDYIHTGFLQGSVKVPVLGFSVVARGTSLDGFESLGGGVRHSISGDSILPFFPDISYAFFYDRINADYFSANHFSASLSASLKVLIFEPFVGIGYDNTDLKVEGHGFRGDGARFTGGLNVSILPFVYASAAYVRTPNSNGAQIGLGARF